MSDPAFVTLDQGDAKFMALLGRFSERLDWMKTDAEQRTRQLEMQAATLSALERGMSKMEGMISGMRDELHVTAKLSIRMAEMETRVSRCEDAASVAHDQVDKLVDFKDGITNKLAMIGLLSFLGGGSFSILAIKFLGGL